jgi:hypothetical protein
LRRFHIWVFPHVPVQSHLFRRLFIEQLLALQRSSQLGCINNLTGPSEPQAFAAYLAPMRKTEWVVYRKPPIGSPEAVLPYFSR